MKKFVHHLCIQTNDYQASLAFYQALGFELKQETAGFHGREYNTWLELNGFYIELQTGKQALAAYDKETCGIPHFCLYVDELEMMLSELETLGVVFLEKNGGKIYSVEGGRLFKVKAPEGTIIEFRDTLAI
ncbi:VOC family protein [Vagococcus zengguangii]